MAATEGLARAAGVHGLDSARWAMGLRYAVLVLGALAVLVHELDPLARALTAIALLVAALGLRRRVAARRLARLASAAAALALVLGVAGARAGGELVLALAVGLLHAGLFVLRPLPDRLAFARRPLAWLAAAGLALAAPLGPTARATALASLGAAWTAVAWLGRERDPPTGAGAARRCVRFRCPRCSVLCDFTRPVSPCSECGLFVRVDWGAQIVGAPAESGPAVLLRCPGCRTRARFGVGSRACAACGLVVRIAWNVQSG